VVVVREAAPSDAAGIGAAHAEAWRVGYCELFGEAFRDSAVEDRRNRWVSQTVRPAADGSALLVAELDGDIAGFVHAGRATDDAEAGEVFGFYVHPRYWGTGVAQALFDRAVHILRADGLDHLFLWTHGGAQRARRFYERNGWSVTGRVRQHDFGDGHQSLLVEYAQDVTRTLTRLD